MTFGGQTTKQYQRIKACYRK